MPLVVTAAFNGHDVRVVMIDGAPWWVAADVCRALDLPFGAGKGSVKRYLGSLAEDEVLFVEKARVEHIDPTDFPNAGANCISESGLYRLVNRSDKPEARPFHAPLARQDWVNREVLPAIRNAHYVLLVLLNG